MNLCARHDDALVMALELRGLLRSSLETGVDLTPLAFARDAIRTHATHFAGRAAVEMLQTKACPLCFVNRNPARTNLDSWIDHAADDALTDDLARADAPRPRLVAL